MTPEDFVQCLRRTKQDLLGIHFDPSSESAAITRLSALGFSATQLSAVRDVLDSVLTDAFYTVLLGLDGCASLGGVQQSYHIRDEHGAEVCSGDGTIEALAYDYFHGNRNA